jgi:hypothetical protein
MRTVAVVLLAGCLGLPGALVSSGFQFEHGRRQMPSNATQNPALSPTAVVGASPDTAISDSMERERRSKYIAEQHSQAMTDARRLTQLAQELQNELDQADGLTLSATSVKKADEIVKLAKSVKSKMRAY